MYYPIVLVYLYLAFGLPWYHYHIISLSVLHLSVRLRSTVPGVSEIAPKPIRHAFSTSQAATYRITSDQVFLREDLSFFLYSHTSLH